jgi:hypothetical protein
VSPKFLDRKPQRLDTFERLTLATIVFLVVLIGLCRWSELVHRRAAQLEATVESPGH